MGDLELLQLIRLIHIISATLLFGVGIASAYHMYSTFKTRSVEGLAQVTSNIVKCDYLFTTPAVLLVPLTGFWLVDIKDYGYSEFWIIASVILYTVSSLCWIPAVSIQVKLRTVLTEAFLNKRKTLPDGVEENVKKWLILWAITFISILIIYGLMTFKPQMAL